MQKNKDWLKRSQWDVFYFIACKHVRNLEMALWQFKYKMEGTFGDIPDFTWADEEDKKFDETNAAFYGQVWRGISPKRTREIRIWLRDAGWLMYPTQNMMANLRLRGLAANPPKLNLDLNSVKDKNNLIHISFKDDETRGRKWQRKKALAEGRLNTANGKIEALGRR